MGTEPESRTTKACRGVQKTLSRVLAIALTLVAGLSYSASICHGQAVKLASPVVPSKDSTKTVTPGTPTSKAAVVEAFDPSTALEAALPVAGKAVPKNLVELQVDPLQIQRTKVATPDVSIAIESTRAVIKIPEKPLATPSESKTVVSPTVSGSASNNANQTSAPILFAEVVPKKISASATRSTPVVVKALAAAPLFPDSVAPTKVEPAKDPAKEPEKEPASGSPEAVVSQTIQVKQPSPIKPEPMALATGSDSTTVGPIALEASSDDSAKTKISTNDVQTASPAPTAVAPSIEAALNLEAAPNLPAQVASSAPSGDVKALTPIVPQVARSPAESIAPYWTVEGLLAIKAPADRSAVADLESLVWAALSHSPYVQSIKLTPMIRETEIRQAQGAFDPSQFVDSIWNDRSDPVGNTLTTGGPLRLNDKILNNKAGIRGRNTSGGDFEASQEMILQNSNSLFFIPRQQADTKMFMRYTQPLMRGAGQAYNRATITIAELNTAAAGQDANQAMQMHVMDLSEAYWRLFYHRSQLLQLRRGVERLKVIATQLENRRDLDLLENQLFRAQAAVKTFESRIARTIADIINDEQRIRRFVNAPWIQNLVCDEIITGSQPMAGVVVLSPEEELGAAFINRPDILAVRDEIQAAKVKLNVAENELRPTLNLVTDMYVRGLNGDFDAANSFADQFSNGRPSYSGGVEYQRPRNLYLAKAIKRQRSLELQQILFRLEDRLLDVSREVLSAVAEVNASLTELNASVGSTMATKSELEYLESRWSSSEFLETSQISLNLEQLLDAQQRLVNAEGSWALAQAEYMIALCRLRFSTGTLLTLGILDGPGVQPEETR